MKSNVLAAYIVVVAIWSTTPIGIVWSAESVHPTMAVLLRMLIAVFLGFIVIQVKGIELPFNKTSCRLYAYSGLGIFAGMSFTYMAVGYLSSGLISLIFGLSPIISGVLANRILGESSFGRIRQISLMISLTGLAVVFSDRLSLNANSWPGLIMILLAVFFFSFSAVLVKSVKIIINPIATTVGALTFTLPLFVIAWWLLDGTLPIDQWQPRSIIAIAYLGVFGSLIGFVAYYFILQNLLASTVALITLMTPVMALAIGAIFNNEIISVKFGIGALLVMMGLFLYLLGERMLTKIKRRRQAI